MQQVVTSAREIKMWKWQWFVPYGDKAQSLGKMYLVVFFFFFLFVHSDWVKPFGELFVCFGVWWVFLLFSLYCFHSSTSCKNKTWLQRKIWTWKPFLLCIEWKIHCNALQLSPSMWRCSRTKGQLSPLKPSSQHYKIGLLLHSEHLGLLCMYF